MGPVDVERRQLEDRIDLLEAGANALESEAVELWERAEKAEAAIRRVQALCDHSRAVVHVGCRCSTDECSGTCGAGKPLAWDLDPAAVLAALDGDSDE